MHTCERAAEHWSKEAAETSKRYQAAEGGRVAVGITKVKDCVLADVSFTAGRAETMMARVSGCHTTYARKAATAVKHEKASSFSGDDLVADAAREASKNPGSPLLLEKRHRHDAAKPVSVPMAPQLSASAVACAGPCDIAKVANVASEVAVDVAVDRRDFQSDVVYGGTQSAVAAGCSCNVVASANGHAPRLSGAVPEETAKIVGLPKERQSQSGLSMPRNFFEEQSPPSPWISAADGKIAFYSQRKQEAISIDPVVVCIVLLVPLLTGRSNLCESISTWDDRGRTWHLHPVALPFWSWLFLLISMAVPSFHALWSCVPLATLASESSASFVLYGILDAVSSLLSSCDNVQTIPIWMRMALSATELVFVEVFAWAFLHKTFKSTRTLCIVAALVLLSFLTASTSEDDEDDLYGRMVSPILRTSSLPAGVSLVAAAALRAARLTLGSQILEPLSQVDDNRKALKVVAWSGLSGSVLVLMVAIMLEGIPPFPTTSNAALGIVLLLIAPVGVVTEMITLQRLPAMTVAALNVSHPFLSIFTTAIFSHGVLTSGQISAIALVLAGASLHVGCDFVAKRKAILQLSG